MINIPSFINTLLENEIDSVEDLLKVVFNYYEDQSMPEPILSSLKNENWYRYTDAGSNIQIALLNILDDYDDIRIIEGVIPLLESDNLDIQEEVLGILGKYDDRRIINYVLPFLEADNFDIREKAIFALRKYSDKRMCISILESLKTTSLHMIKGHYGELIIHILYPYVDMYGCDLFKSYLKDLKWYVRDIILKILGASQKTKEIKSIEIGDIIYDSYLYDTSEEVRNTAYNMLYLYYKDEIGN